MQQAVGELNQRDYRKSPANVTDDGFYSVRGKDYFQQIRGNCSPKSTSTTRVPPIPVFMSTIPG